MFGETTPQTPYRTSLEGHTDGLRGWDDPIPRKCVKPLCHRPRQNNSLCGISE